MTSANRSRKNVEPALCHGGGELPNVTSVHNQIHKIIQDHTGQTVKMGKFYVQFSKHNCGNISLNLSHYQLYLSHLLMQCPWNKWCLMHKGLHAYFMLLIVLGLWKVCNDIKKTRDLHGKTHWHRWKQGARQRELHLLNNLSLPVKVAGLCFCGRLSAGAGAICVQIWVYKWP